MIICTIADWILNALILGITFLIWVIALFILLLLFHTIKMYFEHLLNKRREK